VTCFVAFGFSGLRVERLTFRWDKVIATNETPFNTSYCLQQSQHWQSSQSQVPPWQPSQQLHPSLQQQASFAFSQQSLLQQAVVSTAQQVLSFEQLLPLPLVPTPPLMANATVSERSAKTAMPSIILWFFVIIILFHQ